MKRFRQVGLAWDFAQKATASSTYGMTHDFYTWSQDPAGNPYISSKTSLTDEGMSYQQSALSTQTLDQYGNGTQAVIYPYNNTSLEIPARIRTPEFDTLIWPTLIV